MSSGLRGGHLIAFGFPFSPVKPSPFTGLNNGPGVVQSLLDDLEAEMTLVSRSAAYYNDDDRVRALDWDLSINHKSGAASCVAGVGVESHKMIAPFESLLVEMMGRKFRPVEWNAESPSCKVTEQRLQELRNRVASWATLVEDQGINGYVNSNCPHLVDDFIVYLLAAGKGLPTAFPYRLPIVPGVSARLYIPVGLFDHHAVHGPDGAVVRPEDIPGSEAWRPLPVDLEDIYRHVVHGGSTLRELSAQRLAARGEARPSLWTPPLINPKVRGVLGWLAALIGPKRRKVRVMRSLWATERANLKRLEALTTSARLPENFIYFPLHMQPEASTNPLGGIFSDQLRAVRLLADALPTGWRLAVKEHPQQQLALRLDGWYDALARTPGVTLVPMAWDSFALQQESRAVATVSGAAAWEAWLAGKPAMILGHILYASAPAIFSVRTREQAHEAMQAIRGGRVPTTDEIREYLGRLAYLSFPGHLDAYINPSLSPEQLDPIESEREIGRRLARAIQDQARSSSAVAEHQKEAG